MKTALLAGSLGLTLLILVALSSFVTAAPNPPPPHSSSAPAAVSPGTMTSRVYVFNPDTSGTANVSLQVLKTDGTVAYSFPNFTIPANGGVVKTLPSSITSPFAGSAVVSSDKKVQAYVIDANGANTALETYEGTTTPANILGFSLVRHLAAGTQRSLIAVQNTSSKAGNVTLELFDPTGKSVLSTNPVAIQPSASAYFNTDSLVATGTFTGSALIYADTGMNIAAAEQTEYALDTASFRGLSSADMATAVYVPFVERGLDASGAVQNWSEIYVRNNGDGPTDVTANFYSAAGTPALTVTRTGVPSNGLAQFLVSDSEFAALTSSSSSFSGWLKLTSSAQPIAAGVLDAQSGGSRLFGMNSLPAGQLGTSFVCGDTFRISNPAQTTTLNIVNADAASATVTLKLFKASTGSVVVTKTYTVGSNKLQTLILSDAAFRGAGTGFEGPALITATGANVLVSANTSYGSGGVMSYNCTKLQ